MKYPILIDSFTVQARRTAAGLIYDAPTRLAGHLVRCNPRAVYPPNWRPARVTVDDWCCPIGVLCRADGITSTDGSAIDGAPAAYQAVKILVRAGRVPAGDWEIAAYEELCRFTRRFDGGLETDLYEALDVPREVPT